MGAWCGHAEVSRHPSRRAGQLDEVDSDALGTETPSVPKRLRAAAIRPTVAVSIVLVSRWFRARLTSEPLTQNQHRPK